MKYIKPEDIIWKPVKYIKEPLEATDEQANWLYAFWLNDPLASWDVFSYWEKERIYSMRQHLTTEDILFDIGTEQGWTNLAYAKMIDPKNIFLIEPTPQFWPNIKALWEKNFTQKPIGFYAGLLSNVTNDIQQSFTNWPSQSNGDLIDRNKYVYVHDNLDNVPQMTLDDLVERSGVVPTAITIDVEGAETIIIDGAAKTLTDNNLKVWISVHPDMMLRDYGKTKEDFMHKMTQYGYTGELLAIDHEEHWYFTKV